jgi:hypothetical protein
MHEHKSCVSVSSDCPIIFSVVGESAMIPEPKSHTKGNGDHKPERRDREKALDEDLGNTFPASDPVSVEQPTPPASDRDRDKNQKLKTAGQGQSGY